MTERHDDLSVYLNIVVSEKQLVIHLGDWGGGEYCWDDAGIFKHPYNYYILVPTHLPSEF